jgi:hypothetical protein
MNQYASTSDSDQKQLPGKTRLPAGHAPFRGPMEWQVAIQRHAERPARSEVHVLLCLMQVLDWETGTGYASEAYLAAMVGVSIPVVRRALTWARKYKFAIRTRKGHRITDEIKIASEWLLTMPLAEPTAHRGAVGYPEEEEPTAQTGEPNRSKGQTQPLSTDPPSSLSTSPLSTTTRARAEGASTEEPLSPEGQVQTREGDPSRAPAGGRSRVGDGISQPDGPSSAAPPRGGAPAATRRRTITGQPHRAARGSTEGEAAQPSSPPARSGAARPDTTTVGEDTSIPQNSSERYETALRAATAAIMAYDSVSEEMARMRAITQVKHYSSFLTRAEELEKLVARYEEWVREDHEQVQESRAPRERVVPALAWDIGLYQAGPDEGKLTYYMPVPSEVSAEADFRGTEEELLEKYPELRGQRADQATCPTVQEPSGEQTSPYAADFDVEELMTSA